ncbi:MAG: hypothetical protein Q8O37_17675 [Sulfuricellaceae bacterium]|nr:hypothetical protein [Sulfuricellaceae bacterium]
MDQSKIDDCLEQFSARGCDEVNKIIQHLESGALLEDMHAMTSNERHAVLTELKSIMNVYSAKK